MSTIFSSPVPIHYQYTTKSKNQHQINIINSAAQFSIECTIPTSPQSKPVAPPSRAARAFATDNPKLSDREIA